MPICQNCQEKWTWRQTLKRATITLGGGMTCPYCKEKQYISTASRKKGSIYAVIFPILIFPINIFFDLSIGAAGILVIIMIVILLGVNPFIVELSNEEEPLF